MPAAQRGAVAPFAAPATTRAPSASAIACEPSVLPLSATTTSPSTPSASSDAGAFAMQVAERLGLVEAGHDDRELDHGGVASSFFRPQLGHQDGTWLGGGLG